MTNVARLAAALFEYANRHRRHDYTHPLCVIAGPDRSHSETAAAAILAADPTLMDGELDRAWQRAEAALPEGWAFGGLYLRRGLDFYRARAYRVGVTHPLRAKPSNDVVLGDGPTPTAALTALAEHLERAA